MEFKDLVEKLAKLGFSKYEAKAYITLLKHNPSTGYELAKHSGIPPSKIYEVISRLLARSIISPLSGKPVKYIPQNNKVFLKNLSESFQETIDYLEKYLPTLRDSGIDYIWNVTDLNNFINKAKEMIKEATKEIILLGWDKELQEIHGELKKKKMKKIAIIRLGSMDIDVGVVYNHGVEAVLKQEKGGRMFSLVTDSTGLLQGIISENGHVRGIFTSHPSLVEMAIDHMTHEIYTLKMYDLFEEEMDMAFGGKDLTRMRNIWKRYY
jgi:sugar-specific transcriptional regulator TrmB